MCTCVCVCVRGCVRVCVYVVSILAAPQRVTGRAMDTYNGVYLLWSLHDGLT